jgi:DNA mismatch repair protein MutL
VSAEVGKETAAPEPPTAASAPAAAPTTASDPLILTATHYLGQLHRTYLLCERDDELLLIDQHAAHERVVFERLRRAHRESALASQRLLFPVSLEVDPRRSALIEEQTETLGQLGFELRPFGGRSYALVAAPDLGAYGRGAEVHRDPEQLLRQVLDELEEHGSSDAIAARSDLLLATMACHAAVRAGDLLDEPKAQALLRAMDEVDYSPYCPHGRPVLVRLGRAELERRFGRT